MTQTEIIAKMLAEGRTVTKLTTLPLGIGNLNDVIMKLRRSGMGINTVIREDVTGRTFCAYEAA